MTKRGNIVEPIKTKSLLNRILNKVSLRGHAEQSDEGTTTDSNSDGKSGNGGSSINFEELIQKARREEKEKQYKTIEKLKNQVSVLTEQHNQDILKIGSLEKDLQQANEKLKTAGKDDSEEIKALKTKISDITKEKETLESKVKEFEDNKPASKEEIEAVVRAELEAEYAVKTHKAEILAKHKDELLVPELVFGTTVEELDKSLETALARSKEIREKVGVKEESNNKRTPKTPTNPSTNNFQDQGYTLEYLRSLDPRSEEYKEVRKKLGLK